MVKQNIEKMADLLRTGNTMLNMSCPVCNNPIFKSKIGDTFCPTCNRKVLIVTDQNKKNERINLPHNRGQENISQNRKFELFNLLNNVILEKIEFIAKKLKNETDLNLIKSNVETLSNCIDILNKILIQE